MFILRLPPKLFASHSIRITFIVCWLLLQKTSSCANNNSGAVFCNRSLLRLDFRKSRISLSTILVYLATELNILCTPPSPSWKVFWSIFKFFYFHLKRELKWRFWFPIIQTPAVFLIFIPWEEHLEVQGIWKMYQ